METRSSSYLTSPSDPAVIWDRFSTYSGELAFDVGANGGEVSQILAQRFSKVVAYEPCAESFVHLSELGPPVLAREMALSDMEGELELVEAAVSMGTGQLVTGDSLAFSWGREVGRRVVPASTLDAEAQRWGVPDFIKIDTEGHEARVVAGGKDLFGCYTPALLIEIHAEENAAEIADLLSHYVFRRINHPAYPPESVGARNHFWLVSNG